MKHRIISTVLGTSIFLILLLSRVNGASVASLQTEAENNTALAPIGYTPTRQEPLSQVFTINSADILLIQTSLPWASDANTQVLDALGYSYDIVDMSSIGDVNVFSYPVILIVNDQVQGFYDQYATQVALFENYVTSGGVLVFFAAGAGWAGGQLMTPLPGGVTWIDGYDPTNHIEDDLHPIVTGVLSGGNSDWGGPLTDSDLIGNYCSHGYFANIPVDAQIILANDTWNEPTLMEYTIGNGKVIASTLTWEAYWAWYPAYGGPFAKKALDDIFLYAFSGGVTIVENLTIDLRVEDAPDNVRVKKSAGSYVDVVARIQGGEAYTPTVILQIPSDLFGSPIKTFTRNLPNNEGYGQENEFTALPNGNYQIDITLVPLNLQNQSTFYKEVVWRFQLPNSISEQVVQLDATVAIPGVIIADSADQVKLDVIEWGRSIAITNRERLFEIYGANGNWDEVSDLLEDTYRSLAFEWGEVFYVDFYGIDWNQTTNENAANDIADDIDNLVEQWNDQLTTLSYGVNMGPRYLVIIGGDEIIPFYRMFDDDYSWCSIQGCEEDYWAKNNGGNGPIWDLYADNYFLSDNIYADIGGDQRNWENGDLELAIGRIVGADAQSMRRLLSNAQLETEPLTEAILTSIKGVDIDRMQERLEDRSATIHGLNNPDLTENDNWTRDQFISAWESNSQFFYYGGHANPFNMASGTNQSIATSHLSAGQINNNNPLFISNGCNLAVPIEDGLVHHLVDLGFAGIVGSTGLSGYQPEFWNATMYGEKFVNDYVEKLLEPGRHYSNRFGEALLEAKRDYNPIVGYGRKTMLEYVYYGLPWSFMQTPDNAPIVTQGLGDFSQAFSLNASKPAQVSGNIYSTVLNTTVTSYTLSTADDYDLLLVEGADMLFGEGSPALPYIVHTMFLPLNSNVNSLLLISENSVFLGQQNVPSIIPVTTYDTGTGLIPFTGSGIYPETRYSYEVVPFPEYTLVKVVVYLAEFNADNGTLSLFDSTDLQIEYTADSTAVISKLIFDKPEFQGDETVTGYAIVQNVGNTASTWTGVFEVFNDNGNSVGQISLPAFTVNPGESYELPFSWLAPLSHGGYGSLIILYENGSPVAGLQGGFNVTNGRVSNFEVPEIVKPGEFSEINLAFTNYRSSSIDVVAEILIFDQGVEVAKLLQRNFPVAAHSEETTTWTWNPANLGLGTYTLKAVVSVGDDFYYVPQEDIWVTYYAPSFSASVTSGEVPLNVEFTNNSLPGYITVDWDFGDGSTSNQDSPSHTYLSPGTYTVTLTVSDGNVVESAIREEFIYVQVRRVFLPTIINQSP